MEKLKIPTDSHIENIFRFEKYIPVLTPSEIESLMAAAPSLLVLQDWEERITRRTAAINEIFSRAYKKQK